MRVLVVEDDPTMLFYDYNIIKRVSEKHNIEIITEDAIDGCIAVNKCLKTKYDLILLDLALPKADGKQVARTIRHIGKNKESLIIGCSAYVDKREMVAKAIKAGIDYFTLKPVTGSAIERALDLED